MDSVENSHLQGLIRKKLARGEDELLGPLQPHDAGQQEEPAKIGHQPDPSEHGAKARAGRAEDEVARQRQVKARAVGGAIDRRDHRLFEVDQLSKPGMQTTDTIAVFGNGATLSRQGPEVAAGTKRTLRSSEHDRADVRIVARDEDRLGELGAHLEIKGVTKLGLVQPDEHGGVEAFDLDGMTHGLNPMERAMILRWISLVPSPIT